MNGDFQNYHLDLLKIERDAERLRSEAIRSAFNSLRARLKRRNR